MPRGALEGEGPGASAAAETSCMSGRRQPRKPRINYLQLLEGLAEQNEDPNASARPESAAAGEREEPRPQQAKASDASRGGGSGGGRKRKAAAEAGQAAEPLAAGAGEALEEGGEAADDEGHCSEPEPGDEDYDSEQGPPRRQRQQAQGQGQPKKKRQRVLVNVHGGGAGGQQEPEEGQNEYECARLERIRRNKEVLAQLGISQMAQDLAATAQQAAGAGGGAGQQSRPKQRRERAPAAPPEPVRKSARMRGLDPAATEAQAVQQAGEEAVLCTATDEAGLLSLEEYFQHIGKDVSGAILSDGRFHGWVSPAVCEQYGVAGSADEAWESNGGGKFSFKIDKKAIPAELRGKGWSDARAFAATQLKKNPNSYFYRLVAPHQEQAQGEWTEEEHELFLSTARAHGVGDKWGLFASYIPQRVGYQCSAYYRDVIIPQGLVIDNRFKMTRDGRAVFKG